MTLDPEAWAGAVRFLDSLVARVESASVRYVSRVPAAGLPPAASVSVFVYESDAALEYGADPVRDQYGLVKLPNMERVKNQAWWETILVLDRDRIRHVDPVPSSRPGCMAITDLPTFAGIVKDQAVVIARDGTSSLRSPFRVQDAMRLGRLDGPAVFAAVGVLGRVLQVLADARADPTFQEAVAALGVPTLEDRSEASNRGEAVQPSEEELERIAREMEEAAGTGPGKVTIPHAPANAPAWPSSGSEEAEWRELGWEPGRPKPPP